MKALEALKELKHKRFYSDDVELFNVIEITLIKLEKKDKLLELKNREIKLLEDRLDYNLFDDIEIILYEENSKSLESVRKQIKALEIELE